MSLEILTECPICQGRKFNKILVSEDFTVTNETFTIDACEECSLLITNPRPDQESLPKYYESNKYISHTGQSSGMIDSLYLIVRSYTLKWKRKIIEQYSDKRTTLLDYGCGTGNFLKTCSEKGWDVYGVEPSIVANTKASTNQLSKVYQSTKDLPAIKFDIITLWHVLEHVSNLTEEIEQLRALLTDHGTLFVAVPNHKSYDATTFRKYWAAYDVPRHLWHFSQANIQQIMQNSNMKVVATKPMKFDSYYVSLLSQKYRTKSLTIVGLLKAISIATLSNWKAKTTNEYSSLIYIIKK